MRRQAATTNDGGGWRSRRIRASPAMLAAAVCAVVLPFAAVPAAAAQEPTPGPDGTPAEDSSPPVDVPEPVPGEEACTIADERLDDLSGLVATDDQYIVINDSQPLGLEHRQPVFFLDQDCAVVDERPFAPPDRPFDPEDLELDREDDILWVADIGDNFAAGTGDTPRETVALWRVDLSGGDPTPVIHRFTYPDGEGRDAEALLLDGDSMPVIVTKEAGTAELYRPTDLRPSNGQDDAIPLELVGEFSPPDTGTENPLGSIGRQFITGGAVAPDGSAAVLRTYADALEFDVVDGDVVGAITDGEPRVTPLPDEPQGEAITYAADGAHFLTVSEAPEDLTSYIPTILRYTPTPPPEPEPTSAAEEAPAESDGGGFSLLNSVQDILNLIAAAGLLGLLLVAVGIFGLVRYRRRNPRTRPGRPRRGSRSDEDEPRGEPVPAGAAATGRASARVEVGGGGQEPGWEPGWEAGPVPEQRAGDGPAAGVYTSRTAVGYGAVEEGDGYPAYPADYHGYDPAAYGGYYGPEASGYADPGYDYGGSPDPYYDQRQWHGDAGTYQAGTHQAGGYDGGYYDNRGGYDGAAYDDGRAYDGRAYDGAAYDDGRAYDGRAYDDRGYDAGAYYGGTYRSEAVPDYYSDDPDYPYEFRDRDRW